MALQFIEITYPGIDVDILLIVNERFWSFWVVCPKVFVRVGGVSVYSMDFFYWSNGGVQLVQFLWLRRLYFALADSFGDSRYRPSDPRVEAVNIWFCL